MHGPTQRTRLLSALTLFAAALCAPPVLTGCGGGGGGATPDGGSRDGATDLPVASIAVSIEPGRSAYRTGQTVTAVARVADTEGNPLEGAPVSWSVAPAMAATLLGDGRLTLTAEGTVTVTGCTVGPGELELCDERPVVVDDGSPLLEVSSPAPGDELGGDGAELIEVVGSVSDTRGVAVYVNGRATPVDESGQFMVGVDPELGVNHLEIVASDGLSDESRLEMDVLWADAYRSATDGGGAPFVALDDALVLDLGQPLFDDGQPLDSEATPLVTRDMADVVGLVLSHADVTGSLPDPLVDQAPTFFLRVTDVRLDAVATAMDVTDEGLDLFVRVGALEADTEGMLEVEGEMLDLSGGIDASVAAFARLTVDKADLDAPVTVAVDELVVALEAAQGRFASEEANALFRLAEGLLRTTLEEELGAAFEDTLIGTLPAVLENALGSIDELLRDQQIELDTGAFPAMTLQLDGRIAELETAYRRALTARLRATVSTDQEAVHPGSRGAAELAGVAGDPRFTERAGQIAVQMSLLNSLLHVLWNSGLLELDATSVLPDNLAGAVEEAILEGKLPPLVRPSRAGEPYDLMLSVGQLELETLAFGDRVRYGVRIDAGVTVSVADGAISLAVAEEPEVEAWIIESDTATPAIDDAALEDLLRDRLWPELSNALVDGLMVELPALNVEGLADLAPELSGFALSFEMAAPLAVREGYAVFDVALRGELPSP